MQSQQTEKEEDDEGPPPGWQPISTHPPLYQPQPPPQLQPQPRPPRPCGQFILFFTKPSTTCFIFIFFSANLSAFKLLTRFKSATAQLSRLHAFVFRTTEL